PSGEYAIRTSRINDNDQPDVNAAFFMDRERAPDDPEVVAGKLLREPNKWPADLPGFREFLLRYWEAVESFARGLLPAFAVVLVFPPQAFDRAFEDAQCAAPLALPASAVPEQPIRPGPARRCKFLHGTAAVECRKVVHPAGRPQLAQGASHPRRADHKFRRHVQA